MGIALLANLSAYDFGFIPTEEFLERTSKSLSVMERLERYKGHFFNWYDTQSLTPLSPRYVSSVDSGNMVGHLLVLRAGLQDFVEKRVSHPLLFKDLLITLAILVETTPKSSGEAANSPMGTLSRELAVALQSPSPSASQVRKELEHLQTTATAAMTQLDLASDMAEECYDGSVQETFCLKLQDALDELTHFMKKDVFTEDKVKLGSIEDIIVTPSEGLAYAVVSTGGFLGMGKHDIVVPLNQFKVMDSRFILPGATKETIKAMPEFNSEK